MVNWTGSGFSTPAAEDTVRLRVLGGPAHGTVQEARGPGSDQHLRVMLPDRYRFHVAACNDIPLYSRIGAFEYDSRPVNFGHNCRVYVLAPPKMTEAELMRRLADLIEDKSIAAPRCW